MVNLKLMIYTSDHGCGNESISYKMEIAVQKHLLINYKMKQLNKYYLFTFFYSTWNNLSYNLILI